MAPQGAAGGLTTYLGLAPGFFFPERRTGYTQRWTLGIQRQLGANWLVEVGYTGNRGAKLGANRQLNPVPVQYLSRSPERDNDTINALSRNVPNPLCGITTFSSSPAFFDNANLTRAQLLRPYPRFTGLSTTVNDGFSWYHAGHVRLERRFRSGYSFSGHYTWSKFMEAIEYLNEADLHPHHVISSLDRPHHLAVSSMVDLPVGRGRKWLPQMPRAANFALGGWSLNVIYQWQSDPPIGFGNVLYRGLLADAAAQRAASRGLVPH